MKNTIDALVDALEAALDFDTEYPWAHRAKAAIAQARAEQAEPVAEGFDIKACRGYAHLGIGAYVLNNSNVQEPAELIISIATEGEKAGRAVGEDRANPEGHVLQPEDMVVRLRFENAAGLDALEKQLRFLREEHFQGTAPPAAPAKLEPLMEEELRTAFENWFSNQGAWPASIERHANGPYLLAATQSAWVAWFNAGPVLTAAHNAKLGGANA